MKTTIIKSLAVRRLAILTMATFLLLAMPGHAEDEAAKNNIREIQQVLNKCGFNAGPSDGIWGNRTTKAAQAFAKAHGYATFNDQSLLMAQVDANRLKGNDPCPPEGTEQASDESEPAGEAGSVTAEAGSVEADQAEEVEIIKEDPYKEITELLDGKKYEEGFENPSVEFEIIEEGKSLLIREQKYCNILGCVWYFPLSELEARYYDSDDGRYSGFEVGCRNDDKEYCGYRSGSDTTDDLGDPYGHHSDLYEALAAGRESVKRIGWHERRRSGYGFLHYHEDTEEYGEQPMFTREEEKRIVAAFDEGVNKTV